MPRPIVIDYWSDPTCAWSWAAQPALDQLLRELGERIVMRYRMLPLYRNLAQHTDPTKGGPFAHPAEIGKEWLQVSERTGVPVDPAIWENDPPSSTWPACKAVKAAAQQSSKAAESYLKRLRAAALTERQNVARYAVLLRLAEEAGLDAPAFERDLAVRARTHEIQEDIREAKRNNIRTRPSFLFQNAGGDRVLTVGLRSAALFGQAVRDLLLESD